MARGGSRRQAGWDTAVAHQMYMSGSPYDDIARVVGVKRATVVSYAHRHWPDRRNDRNADQRALVRNQAQLLGIGRKKARAGQTLPTLKSLVDDDA